MINLHGLTTSRIRRTKLPLRRKAFDRRKMLSSLSAPSAWYNKYLPSRSKTTLLVGSYNFELEKWRM